MWAALLLGAVVFAYLWPVLVGGKILSPIAILYAGEPWRGYTPPDIQSYFNPLLIDLPLVDYPWRFLVRGLLHEGTLPAWNPSVLGGIPLYSNPQTGLFSPFNLPLWILPLTYALGVSAALKLLAAGLGTFMLSRQLRLGFLPGVLAGIAFSFSAINIVWLAHETPIGVLAMLPWAIWLVERIFERGRLSSAVGLAFVTAIGLGGGHPGMQVHLIVVVCAYAVARALFVPPRRQPGLDGVLRRQALALIGAGVGAGALLMAFMLVPEVRASQGTVGLLARQTQSLPGDHLPFASIRTTLFPDWWGRPSAVEANPTASNLAILQAGYVERTFYAGVVATLLALVGLVAPGDWRRKAPFAAIGVLGLAVALRAPGLHWLVTHLPVISSVEPGRIHFAFALAVAVLAAFGLQAVLDAPAGDRRRFLVPLCALVLGVLLLVTTGASGDLGRTLRHFVRGDDFQRNGVLALTSVAWFLLLALGVSAAFLLARRLPRRRVAVAALLVLLAAADSYHFAHGFQPMGPRSRVIPPVTPAVAYLIRHRDDGRIVGVNSVLPNDWGIVYGLQDVRGYDPPQPTTEMLALWQMVNPKQISWSTFIVPAISPRAVRVLSVLGARYVIAEPGAPIARASGGALRTVYSGSDATIAENVRTTPRVLVPSRVIVTPGDRASNRVIAGAGFDPRTMAVVERRQPGASALAGAPAGPVGARDSVAIVRERDARVTLRADLARRGLVMLDESLMPGWSVRVDGRSVPAVRVDGVMRGVVVPAGRHRIEWTYEVPGLRLGALVSALALATLIAALAVPVVRSRRAAIRS